MHFTLCTFHHNQPFHKCICGHLFTSHYAPGFAHAFPTLHLRTILSGSGHCDAQVEGAGRWPHFLAVTPLVSGWAGFEPRQGNPRPFINIAHLVHSPFKRTDTFSFNEMLYLKLWVINLVRINTNLNKSGFKLVPESTYSSDDIQGNKSDTPRHRAVPGGPSAPRQFMPPPLCGHHGSGRGERWGCNSQSQKNPFAKHRFFLPSTDIL